MSRTPAGERARIKITYPRWRICHTADLYTARHRISGHVLRSATVAGLENQLFRAEWNARHGKEGKS